MTREEAIEVFKTEHPYNPKRKDNDLHTLAKAFDLAISALSTEGEYIKKSELLQHVTTEELSDYKDCDVIHAEKIDELTTYSFPDSAENKGDLISRQAVLDELEKWDWQDLYLPIHFKQILDDVPPVDNKGEWIPVSERLPEKEKERYLIDYEHEGEEYITVSYYDKYGFWSSSEVKAWQPLPEPYKKGE